MARRASSRQLALKFTVGKVARLVAGRADRPQRPVMDLGETDIGRRCHGSRRPQVLCPGLSG